jgi:hypothetical protein
MRRANATVCLSGFMPCPAPAADRVRLLERGRSYRLTRAVAGSAGLPKRLDDYFRAGAFFDLPFAASGSKTIYRKSFYRDETPKRYDRKGSFDQ